MLPVFLENVGLLASAFRSAGSPRHYLSVHHCPQGMAGPISLGCYNKMLPTG